MWLTIPGVRGGANSSGLRAGSQDDLETICEECNAAKNTLDCIDASIQVDLSEDEDETVDNAMGRKGGREGESKTKKGMPMYSREDIREQYCINDKELQVFDSRRKRGIMGCFSDNGQAGISPCSRSRPGKKGSLLTSCIGRDGSDEELSDSVKGRPTSPGRQGNTWTGRSRGAGDEDDGFDENYFRRRPKSFCLQAEGRRYGAMDPGMRLSSTSLAEENYLRSIAMCYQSGMPMPPMMRPGSGIIMYNPYQQFLPMHMQGMLDQGQGVRPPSLNISSEYVDHQTQISTQASQATQATQPNTPDLLIHRRTVNDSEVSLDDRKQKHVSFDSSSLMRSQTVSAMTEEAMQKSVAAAQTPLSSSGTGGTPTKSHERLLDGRKSSDYAYYSELFTPDVARQIVLEKLKKASMRTQATQTDRGKQTGRIPSHAPYSPHILQRAQMISESVQTNGLPQVPATDPLSQFPLSPQSYQGQPCPPQSYQGRKEMPQATHYTTLPHKRHQQYEVQVYNLDSPNGATTIPSTRYQGCKHSSSYQILSDQRGLSSSSTEASTVQSATQCRDCSKARSASSDNILTESESLPQARGTPAYMSSAPRQYLDPPRHARLRKSMSEDGMMDGRMVNYLRNNRLEFDGANDNGLSESELPELAPVKCTDGNALEIKRRPEGTQDGDTRNKDLYDNDKKDQESHIIEQRDQKRNIEHKSDEKLHSIDKKDTESYDVRDDVALDSSTDDVIGNQQVDNSCDEPDIGQKLSPLGSTSSLRDLIDCTAQEKENNNGTWNDSQVTVISKHSPKSIDEKVSSPSLATTATASMERTESISSETLYKDDGDVSRAAGEMSKSSRTSVAESSPIETSINVDSRLETSKEKVMTVLPEVQSVPKIEKDFIGSNNRGNSQESDSSNGHSKKPKDLNICMSRTDSGTSAKTNETSTSDEYITAQEFSAQSSACSRNGSSLRSPKEIKVNGLSKVIHKLNIRDDEIQAVKVKPPCDLPTVPLDIEYNKPLLSPPVVGEPKLRTGIPGPGHVQISSGATDISELPLKAFQMSGETCSLRSVGSGSVSSEGLGFVSPSLSTEIKSPLSETSSSSGSYSVTTDSDPKKQEKDKEESQVSITDCDSFHLSKGNGEKAEADIIFMEDIYDRQQEIMRQDDEKYQGSRPPSRDKEDNSEIIEFSTSECRAVEQKKGQLVAGNNDWSCEERSQRKQCMKLNLPGDTELPRTGDTESENSVTRKTVDIGNGNVKGKKSAFEQQINLESPIKENVSTSKIQTYIKKNGKAPKTPSSIPREIAEEVFTPGQTLARSPAMHEGFRLKDWKVERTPINTPGTPDLHATRLPQLSDEEEENGSESLDIGSETDPISKGSGTSSFFPSSMDVSDSRPASSLPDKTVDAPDTRPGSSTLEKEELPPLVKPPAGFTDSPEKQKAIEIPGYQPEISTAILAEEEVMEIKEATPIAEFTDIIEKAEVTEVLPEEKCHFSRKESYHHPELYVPKEYVTTVLREEAVKMTSVKTTSRPKSKSRSRSRSKSGERLLHEIASQMACQDNTSSTSDQEDAGIYTGEYQRQAWVFVGEVTNLPHKESDSPREKLPLSRSASIESTQSEKEFTKKYQAITHRMVHRKSSAIMYSRILERTFECNKTVVVERVRGEFGFRIHGSRPVVVSAIEPDTPAASSGLVVGDILLTINGANVLDLPHSQVVQVAQRGADALTLGVARTEESPEQEETVWDKLSGSMEVLAAGHLWKKKRSVVPGQQWTRRWFILRADHCLYSFKSENETKPSGAILLPGCSLQTEVDPEKEHCFQIIRPDHTSLWLATDSGDSNQEWTDALARAATRRRSQSNIWLDVATERMNMAAMDQPRPDCRGFLNQMSTARVWRRRYFVLMDGCLYVYKDQEDQKATGVIFLHGYKTQSANFSGKRHAFEMIPTDPGLKHFYFHAQTETEKKRWLAALEYSIDRWMRLS